MLSATAAGLEIRPAHFSAIVGVPTSAPVAVVVGKNASATSDYQTFIDWGDSTGFTKGIAIAALPSGKALAITNSHVYSKSGLQTVRVTLSLAGRFPGRFLGQVTEKVMVRAFPARARVIRAKPQVQFTSVVGLVRRVLPSGQIVTIDWGDGTAPTTTAAPGGKRARLSASHTYEFRGRYKITVTQLVQDSGDSAVPSATILVSKAIVREGAFSRQTIQAQAVRMNPIAGEPSSTAPGQLIDVPASIKSATVQIDWGDGSAIDNLTASYLEGTITPIDSHTYQHAGSYKTVVTFREGDLLLGSTSEAVTVADVSPGGVELAATTGTQFKGVVGTISHLYPVEGHGGSGALLSPTAVGVEWGDGTRSQGTFVDLGNDQYQVTGAHTYAKPGVYRIHVVGGIGAGQPWAVPRPPNPLAPSAPVFISLGTLFTTAQSVMNVSGNEATVPPPTAQATGLSLPDAYVGLVRPGPVAELQLPQDPYQAQIYAVIDWGDGTSDVSDLLTNYQNGAYTLESSHQYTTWPGAGPGKPVSGTLPVSITFMLNDHEDTSQNTVLATAMTSVNVLPSSQGAVLLDLVHGVPFSGSLGTFVANSILFIGATVDWGDGSALDSNPVVTAEGPAPETSQPLLSLFMGDETYQISATHTYSTPGQYRVVVEATERRISSTAIDGDTLGTLQVLVTIATVL